MARAKQGEDWPLELLPQNRLAMTTGNFERTQFVSNNSEIWRVDRWTSANPSVDP
jgi:hypothetical protein